MLKKICIICSAGMIAITCGFSILESAENSEWKCIIERRIEQPLTYAGFVNKTDGITVGVHSAVYYTTDAGKNWKEGLNVSQCRHGLEMLDDGFAWHCGNRSVRRSFNGGKRWYRAADFGEGEPDHARFISFADENCGFIATDKILGITDDGGIEWKTIPLPDGVKEIAAASMSITPEQPSLIASENMYRKRKVTGRLLDSGGRIWRMNTDHTRWSEENSPLRGMKFTIHADAPSTAMRFTPDGKGVIAAIDEEGGSVKCRVFRSKNNGTDWQAEHLSVIDAGTLFISPDGMLITVVSDFNRIVRVYERK
jgi:hypothetical protein